MAHRGASASEKPRPRTAACNPPNFAICNFQFSIWNLLRPHPLPLSRNEREPAAPNYSRVSAGPARRRTLAARRDPAPAELPQASRCPTKHLEWPAASARAGRGPGQPARWRRDPARRRTSDPRAANPAVMLVEELVSPPLEPCRQRRSERGHLAVSTGQQSGPLFQERQPGARRMGNRWPGPSRQTNRAVEELGVVMAALPPSYPSRRRKEARTISPRSGVAGCIPVSAHQ